MRDSPPGRVRLLELEESWSPKDFTVKCLPHAGGGVIVAGLPRRFYNLLSECTLLTALAYTAEERVQGGGRIRNTGLLFLAGLLGKKQARDVVDEIDKVDIIVIAGLDENAVVKASTRLSRACKARPLALPPCSLKWLEEMASARLRRIR